MKWEKKGHEYDEMAKLFDDFEVSYYIWGAGIFGKAFLDEFGETFFIKAFIDKNKKKQKTSFCNLDVLSPEVFFNNYKKKQIVIVSTGQTRSVYDELEKFGLKRHQDFFHIDEISSIYMMYKCNKVYVSDLTLDITECCTLKCEHCNAFMPKIDKPQNFSVEQIVNELELYFQWVDVVNVMGICGGDAMVHPQFNEILNWLGETYYPKKIKHIEVYSNAVLIPNQETLRLFKKYNVIYRFTDYYGNSGKQNISEVVELLVKNDIMYDHVQFDTWYDCGYPQESNGITSEKELIRFFEQCDRKTCHGIMKEKLLFCSMCVSADRIGYCKIEKEDYFDLRYYSEDRRKEFIEFYLGYCEKGYLSYCKKCNGSMNVNTKKIEVGMQVKKN